MRPTFHTSQQGLPLVALLALCERASQPKSFAAERSGIEQRQVRCSASAPRPNEAPYSQSNGTGFENRIAEAVAKAMGRKADFVWSDRPAIYLVRDQLDPKNCDVVIGVDSDDPRVLTTKPYYRAPYVFVERADSPLDITSWDSPGI